VASAGACWMSLRFTLSGTDLGGPPTRVIAGAQIGKPV
jgi:hypothetical protein